MARTFDESTVYKGRIVYVQASVPENSGGLKATMFSGKIIHSESEPIGDGRLWEMLDCDIMIIPRKRYALAKEGSHSIDYARSIMGKMDEWKEVEIG